MRRFLGVLLLTALLGCSAPKTFDVATRPVSIVAAVPRPTLTEGQRLAFHRWILMLRVRAYLEWVFTFTHTPFDWYAIAACETGGNWNVTGSRYSTGLGMENEAIRENSVPAVAARELAGTATIIEIVGTARSIESKHGIHAWGCGRKLYP